MGKQTRNEVVPFPAKIAEALQYATRTTGTWNAIQEMRLNIAFAQEEAKIHARTELDKLAQHIDVSIRLNPGIIDYAMKYANLDDDGKVSVVLIENNYTEEELNADVEYIHYNITMTCAPYYIIHEGRSIVVDNHEMRYRTVEPLPITPFNPENMSPTMPTMNYTETKLKIERFGYTIETPSLRTPTADLIRRVGYEMKRAIDEGRTHKVVRN